MFKQNVNPFKRLEFSRDARHESLKVKILF